MPGADLACAAGDRGHQIAPAVLGDPHAGHVEMPELIGTLDAEEPRPPASLQWAAALDEPALAHHAQHPLAVDRAPEPPPRPGADHPVAVGRVGLGHLDDRRVDLVDGWAP